MLLLPGNGANERQDRGSCCSSSTDGGCFVIIFIIAEKGMVGLRHVANESNYTLWSSFWEI